MTKRLALLTLLMLGMTSGMVEADTRALSQPPSGEPADCEGWGDYGETIIGKLWERVSPAAINAELPTATAEESDNARAQVVIARGVLRDAKQMMRYRQNYDIAKADVMTSFGRQIRRKCEEAQE
ncbi:hypothetical protein [Salinicola avicenniae]|uniref:hypothetical protein n=1 Tax=Salinicola avicenniae TaxID=2916836 RepID=UPI002072E039|nr:MULTISPECIES: hypothetical protein [unclassified Salinicola]